ncbi:MAG: N-acetylmuramoyl-L-alanine amidase [bacterium]|nr:N-acetylmuramoyl-L-alanine amidase [bacterium]
MMCKEQIFGMVRKGEFTIFAPQQLEGITVRLTALPMDEAHPPENGRIDISKYEGKIIEVCGDTGADWLYSARVIEEAGPVLSDFLKKVFLKDAIKQKRCALVIGHKKESPGAANERSNLSEFEFNERLVPLIEQRVKNTVIHRVYRRTYAALPEDINELDADFVVSLHCNSYDTKTSGTQVLYYYRSFSGKAMAAILLKNLVEHLGLPDRGIHANCSEDKCGYLLCYTGAPGIIAEPFFIDNDGDLARATEDLEGLAAAYAKAIDEISLKVKIDYQHIGEGIAI